MRPLSTLMRTYLASQAEAATTIASVPQSRVGWRSGAKAGLWLPTAVSFAATSRETIVCRRITMLVARTTGPRLVPASSRGILYRAPSAVSSAGWKTPMKAPDHSSLL